MARIQAYSSQYCPPGATTTVASGPGKIHSLIATAASAVQIGLYDNTTGSGTALLSLFVSAYGPISFNFKDVGPIRFHTGLTVVVPASSACFVVIEK
jgi:alpha-D-ribose 1-methylphosphonate 5-triphosphate synthase subunit PhnH